VLLRRQNGAVWAVTDGLSDEKSPVLAWDDRHQQVRIIFFSERYIETLRHPEVTLSNMLSAVTAIDGVSAKIAEARNPCASSRASHGFCVATLLTGRIASFTS